MPTEPTGVLLVDKRNAPAGTPVVIVQVTGSDKCRIAVEQNGRRVEFWVLKREIKWATTNTAENEKSDT